MIVVYLSFIEIGTLSTTVQFRFDHISGSVLVTDSAVVDVTLGPGTPGRHLTVLRARHETHLLHKLCVVNRRLVLEYEFKIPQIAFTVADPGSVNSQSGGGGC